MELGEKVATSIGRAFPNPLLIVVIALILALVTGIPMGVVAAIKPNGWVDKIVSAIASLGVASPEPGQADAADLAGYVREQWSIESLHWIRDTLYQEDKSQVRTRSGPRIMAALRNLAIGALRLAGRIDITEATRWAGRSMDRPFTILGLTS